MRVNRLATAIAAAALNVGVMYSGSIASAADMPVKALPPPPASPWVFDVHGFADLTVANTRVTGSGLYLYPRAAVVQPSLGLSLDIYKDPKGFINSFSVFGGVWNETWTDPRLPVSGRHWQEMDWWAGASVGFAEHWKISAQHLEFLFPGGGAAINDTATLSFDDSYLGWLITFNPYINAFYTERGGSVVFLGKRTDAIRFDAGISPTYSFLKSTGIPFTITAPISVAFGPSEFWNRNDGTTNFCGPLTNAPCALSNVGYYSAGLQGKLALDSVVPKRLGNWYVKGGVQWYHLDNDALLAAQTVAGGIGSVPNFPSAKRDIAVVSGSTGFSF
jgi:hypothetical protein